MARLNLPGVSPREGRTILRGVFTVILALTAFRGIPAWLAWRGERLASAAELRVEVARAERDVRGLLLARENLAEAVQELSSTENRLIAVGPLASGSANLINLVGLAGRTTGVDLSAVRVLPNTVEVPLATVAVAIEGQADIRGLVLFLHFLESGDPLVAIRDLSINQPQPGAPRNVPESLQFALTIHGLVINTPEEPSS